MARFVFAFESLKLYRNNRLLAAKREMMIVEERLIELKGMHRQVVDCRRELMCELLLLGGYIEGATQRMRQIEKEILACEEDLHRHRSWVTHLGRELKIVEKLEEKRRGEFDADIKLREKRHSDNWVTDNWSRKDTNLGEKTSDET